MKEAFEAELLRVFVCQGDKDKHRPLYEAVVDLARKRGLAGATVLRGIMGFGEHGRLHTARVLRLSENLPLVIEIVDKPERIEAFLSELDAMISDGCITLERVKVIACRCGRDKQSPLRAVCAAWRKDAEI